METFCFIPVESLSQRRPRKSFIASRSKIASMRCRRVGSSSPCSDQSIPPFLAPRDAHRGGRRRKKPHAGAHFLGVLLHVVARDGGGALGRSQNCRQDAQGCGFPRAIGAQQSENFTWPAPELRGRQRRLPRASCRGITRPCASICGAHIETVRAAERALRSATIALALARR